MSVLCLREPYKGNASRDNSNATVLQAVNASFKQRMTWRSKKRMSRHHLKNECDGGG